MISVFSQNEAHTIFSICSYICWVKSCWCQSNSSVNQSLPCSLLCFLFLPVSSSHSTVFFRIRLVFFLQSCSKTLWEEQKFWKKKKKEKKAFKKYEVKQEIICCLIGGSGAAVKKQPASAVIKVLPGHTYPQSFQFVIVLWLHRLFQFSAGWLLWLQW